MAPWGRRVSRQTRIPQRRRVTRIDAWLRGNRFNNSSTGPCPCAAKRSWGTPQRPARREMRSARRHVASRTAAPGDKEQGS